MANHVSMIFAEAHTKFSSIESSVSVQPDKINHGKLLLVTYHYNI